MFTSAPPAIATPDFVQNQRNALLSALEDAVFELQRFVVVHGDRAAAPCLDRATNTIAEVRHPSNLPLLLSSMTSDQPRLYTRPPNHP